MFVNKNKTGISAILFILVISGSFIVLSQGNQTKSSEISSPSGIRERPKDLRFPPVDPRMQERREEQDVPGAIPTDVTYRQIFKHLAELETKAADEQRKGRDGKKFRDLYKKMARLDEKQARALDRIAEKANRELKQFDDRAKDIVKQIRARTPNRRLEAGQKVPLPPQELFDLAKQRREITMKAVKELRENFGSAGSVNFTKFVNEKVIPGIRKKGNGAEIRNPNEIQKGGKRQ
ncbi:MAG: hypothetical protein R2681_06660 [Pyrinomonadaceae bacterium]